MANVKAAHHRGNYQVTAARVRALAYASSATRCWRCGLTLAEHRPHRDGQPARWTAGHLIDGQPGGPLAPEASTCNYSQGAIKGNHQRARTPLTW